MIWFWLSAALMTATAVAHSILGEKKLIGPQLRDRRGVMEKAFARTITRYAWHVTSALMLVSALTVVWPGAPHKLIGAIGAIWLLLGLVSLISTRGKHVGWPVLCGAGLCALIGAA
ncbi:MAG: hypothetical protein ABIO43_05235 [Sphingomicrobium sp.]